MPCGWRKGKRRVAMKGHRYELITTKTGMDMPYAVSGASRRATVTAVKRKLRKGERIISLRQVPE